MIFIHKDSGVIILVNEFNRGKCTIESEFVYFHFMETSTLEKNFEFIGFL